MFVGGLLLHIELHLDAVLLGPLQELRLEVNLLIGHLVDIDHLGQDTFLHEAHHGIIALIQIDCTNQGLKGIASHIAVMRTLGGVALNEFSESHLLCQLA